MFSLVQKAVGYIAESVTDTEVNSAKCERPRLEDFISVSNFEKEEFEGTVTAVDGRDVVVNNDIYYCIPLHQSTCAFKVGDVVQGTAERKSKYEAWRAISLSLSSPEEKWDGRQPKLTGQVISSRDLDAGIPGILKRDLFPTDGSKISPAKNESAQGAAASLYSDKTELPKTVIGKVTGIVGDTVTLNDKYFRLSTVISSFELAEGDWVICKVNNGSSVSTDLKGFLPVTHVDPLRKKKIKGVITGNHAKHLVINKEVYCSKVLIKEMPSVMTGDNVIVEVIESDSSQYWWRALSLSLDKIPEVVKGARLNINSRLKVLNSGTPDLFDDRHGIVISHSLKFGKVQLNSESFLTVPVKNGGKEEQSLLCAYFVTASQDSQLRVVSEDGSVIVDSKPVLIQPNQTYHIRFACNAKYIGHIKQLCIFDFGSFKMGRYVTAAVEDKHMKCIGPTASYCPVDMKSISLTYRDNSRIVKGEKPFKAPAFLPKLLQQYHVPPELFMAVLDKKDVVELLPLLSEPINLDNYQDNFSALLHLEEIAMTLQMRKFDMERAVFSQHGEFLSLSVPGLAEKRPSLMIGDSVVASNPGDFGGTEYEGCIHEVLHNKILLKFHPSFHSNFEGKDYAVRFNFSRTSLRRCHFALKFAMEQLGSDVLFPKKLKYKLPQVIYIDPESFQHSHINKDSTDTQAWKLCHHKNSVQKKTTSLDNNNVSCSKQNFRNLNMAGISVEVDTPNSFHSSRDGRIMTLDADASEASCKNEQETMVKYHPQHSKLEVVSNTDKANISKSKLTNSSACKNHQDEKFVEEEIRIGCKRGLSPSSMKIGSKGSSSVTPARIPVVTRLFGVPSSGSSANSSICCSDDELKLNSESDSEIRPKRHYPKKKLFSELNNSVDKESGSCRKTKIMTSCESSTPENSSFSDLDGSFHGVPERNVRTHVNKAPKNMNLSKSFVPRVEGKETESHGCHQLSCNRTPNCDIFNVNNQMKAVLHDSKCLNNHKAVLDDKQEVLGNVNPVKSDTLVELAGNGFLSEGKKSQDGKSQVKTISFDELLKEKDNRNLMVEYCIPVLPKRSFSDEQLKSGKVPLLKWFNKRLNSEQKLAVQRILEGNTRPIPYVIYGPPGTGKTITLVETILQIYTLVHHSRLLIVTPSNSAADLVTERLINFNLLEKADLVRLNAYQRKDDSIPESIRSYCYNGDELSIRVRQRVIITTATTAGIMYKLGLHNGHFTHVFVDEAGQLTEPECLVALGLVNSVSGQIVLAGDPQQLGPVIQSRLAKDLGLQESLLHRLCSSVLYQPEDKHNGQEWSYEPRLVTKLVRNYRSHEDIISTSSKLFYHGSLVPLANSEVKEKLLGWSELPNPTCPLLFHAVVGENLQEGDSPSWFNPTETFQVVRYAKSLINHGLIPSSIGIITPYRKQVEKIRQLFIVFGVEDGIKVGTVEEFQGQERTAIIISTVRSSEELLEVDVHHSLGFVKCPKRFNVALTRAQSLLIVVGNPFLLALDNCWMSFINFCLSKKAYVGAEFQWET